MISWQFSLQLLVWCSAALPAVSSSGVLCSGHEGEGLNVRRHSFEAEGRKHWGGTFCYSWMLCLGLRSFVLYTVILS